MIRFFVAVVFFVLAEAQFRSPTGRRVSIRDLPNGYPQPIYEFFNGYLLGPNTCIHVNSETSQMKVPYVRNIAATININGQREVSRQWVDTEIRHGHGLMFMFTNKKLLAVSGTDINLRPLKRYPGLFTNTLSQNEKDLKVEFVKEEDPDDDIAPEPERNITDSESSSLSIHTTTRQTSCASRANLFYEIAVAYDNTFCEEFGGDEAAASAMIQVLVDASNVAYTRDTCVTLALVHIDAHCNDPSDPYDYRPFGSCPGLSPTQECTNSMSILYGFREFWNTQRTAVRRDGAFLFTGYTDSTSTIGLAFLKSACGDYAFGWIEGINLLTFAHEIGHTLGSGHRTGDGIMKKGHITNFGFLPESVQQISTYIDSSRASCITDDAPIFDVVNGGCSAVARSGSQCLTGKNVPSPLVPCSPIQGNFYCLTPVGSRRFLFVGCPDDGFKFIRRANDPSDPSILCCTPPARTTARNMLQSTVISPSTSITDGSIVHSNGVKNNSQITRETLLETSVVASCIPPPTLELKIRTCKETMPATDSFKSITRRIRPFSITNIGTLSIVMTQRFDMITITATSNKHVKIQRLSFKVRVKNGGFNVPLSITSTSRREFVFSFDPFKVTVGNGRRNCCGMPLKINLRYTLKNKDTGKRGVAVESFQYKMTCERVL